MSPHTRKLACRKAGVTPAPSVLSDPLAVRKSDALSLEVLYALVKFTCCRLCGGRRPKYVNVKQRLLLPIGHVHDNGLFHFDYFVFWRKLAI